MALPKQWNGDVALATLNPAYWAPELYYPLWLYSGGSTTLSGGGASWHYLTKGTTTPTTSLTALFTLNSNSASNTQYALEAALQTTTTGGPITATLWDITANSQVSGSTISTTSTTMTVVRSGAFTLIPGHSYGVAVACNFEYYITDASLIIFPPSPTTSPYDVASVSLANPSGNTLKEAYVPIWVMSSSYVYTGATVSGDLIEKGSTSYSSTSSSTSANTLLTLSSKWSSSQKFAFETAIYNGSSGTSYVALYDLTSNSIVSSSQVSIASSTSTVVRSGSFNLNPGHSYGVTIWSTTGNTYLSKAHLVALSS